MSITPLNDTPIQYLYAKKKTFQTARSAHIQYSFPSHVKMSFLHLLRQRYYVAAATIAAARHHCYTNITVITIPITCTTFQMHLAMHFVENNIDALNSYYNMNLLHALENDAWPNEQQNTKNKNKKQTQTQILFVFCYSITIFWQVNIEKLSVCGTRTNITFQKWFYLIHRIECIPRIKYLWGLSDLVVVQQ